MLQVRFKDEFYGHSEMTVTEDDIAAGKRPADAVAEWRALQKATPPVLLADHLTWLRVLGRTRFPRLLATCADRPPPSPSSRSHTARATRHGGNGAAEREQGNNTSGATGKADDVDEASDTGLGKDGQALPIPSAVPLEPFLRMVHGSGTDHTLVYPSRRADAPMKEAKQVRSRLTPGVNTGLSGKQIPPALGARAGDEKDRGGEIPPEEISSAGRCRNLHLVVDGVVFQVHAACPDGIARVWTNVLPAVGLRSLREREKPLVMLSGTYGPVNASQSPTQNSYCKCF